MSFYSVYESPRRRRVAPIPGLPVQAELQKSTFPAESKVICFTPKIGVGQSNLLPHFDPRLGTLNAISVEFSLFGEFISCATVDLSTPISGTVQKKAGVALTGSLHTVNSSDTITFDFTSFLSAPPPGAEGKTLNLIDEGTFFHFSGSAMFFDSGSISAMTQASPFPLADFWFEFDNHDVFAAFPDIIGRANPNIFRATSTLSVSYYYTPAALSECLLDPSVLALFDVSIEGAE